MKIFKRIFSLTAAVLLSVPTITAPASGAEASEDGSVEVSAVSDYSVFEAIKIRRSIINQDGVYTFSDYKDVSTYLVNNSLKNIRYFTLSYDTEGADTSAYADPSVLDADTVVYKSSVRVASANLYNDGYIHYGWYFDGQIYKVGDYIKIPDCDVVFTPVWYKRCQINYYAGDYDDVADAAIVVISAGAGQKPGETRLDLVNKNVAIFKSIIPEIAKRNFTGIMLVVANPVDILTQVAIKLSGLPENRVIGSGTVLDSARLRYKLGEHLSVDSRSVHAFIVGEHGDSEVVAWSSANVSGVPLSEMCEMRGHYKHKENTAEIATAVKNSAYEIINKKHATYYGIAMSVKRICEVIMRDEKSILPVSHMMHGVYDIDGVSLSMPAIVGADGIESDIPINLSGEEALKLKESADSLKKIMETIEL